MNDDLDTIRRVLAADVESFRRLVERYQRPLLTLIRNLTPPDIDHEGVGQEVFLAAFRALASFDPKRSAFSTLDKAVFVNGRQLPREPAPRASLGAAAQVVKGELFEETNAGRRYRILFATDTKPLPDYPKAKVPDGMCFVLGDNRNNSRDSRTIGFVALDDVLGDVQYRYWPAATWTRFGVVTE